MYILGHKQMVTTIFENVLTANSTQFKPANCLCHYICMQRIYIMIQLEETTPKVNGQTKV